MKALIISLLLSSTAALADEYGTYSVPVPAELEPYATFVLPDTEVITTNKQVMISYNLPEELVGTNHPRIELKGEIRPGRVLVLKGKYGKANCLKNAAQTECVIDYKKLRPDMVSAEAAIANRTPDLSERMARIQVAKLFASEPVGVFTFHQ